MSADLFWVWAWARLSIIVGSAILLALAWRDQERKHRELRRRADNVLNLRQFGRRERR